MQEWSADVSSVIFEELHYSPNFSHLNRQKKPKNFIRRSVCNVQKTIMIYSQALGEL